MSARTIVVTDIHGCFDEFMLLLDKVHYGSNVWTLEAAKDRREALGSHIPRTWIETFTEGSWKRVGDVVHSSEPTPPESV